MLRTRAPARLALATVLTLAGLACDDDQPAGPNPSSARDGAADAGAADAGAADAGSQDTTAQVADGPTADAPTDDGGPDGRGPDSGEDGSVADSAGNDLPAADAAPLTAEQKRGQYLVDVVLGCGVCHTPAGPTGAPDPTRYLAGKSCLIDFVPTIPGTGCVSVPNLTNHETGLKNIQDPALIKDMFQKGRRPDGKFLRGFMPYYEYANLTAGDADAIVAYLRTVPGIDNRPPATEPPFDQPPVAAYAPVDPATVPLPGPGTADVASAMRGRALAMVACMGCHSPEKPMPILPHEMPLDVTKLFAGGREIPAYAAGLPVPPFPLVIYTSNLTQDATGLLGWTAGDIQRALKMGLDREGKKVCPPMPSGPMGHFGQLTDGDAQDIATYLASLPGIAHALPNGCALP